MRVRSVFAMEDLHERRDHLPMYSTDFSVRFSSYLVGRLLRPSIDVSWVSAAPDEHHIDFQLRQLVTITVWPGLNRVFGGAVMSDERECYFAENRTIIDH